MATSMGIKQKLQSAGSQQEVTDLLNAGLKFEFASKKTVNGWKNAARHRLNDLQGVKAEAPKPKQEAVEVVKVPKKRGAKKNLD